MGSTTRAWALALCVGLAHAAAAAYDADALASAVVSDWRSFTTVQPWTENVRDGDGSFATQQSFAHAVNAGGMVQGQSAESWALADLSTARLAGYSRASVATASDRLSSTGTSIATMSDSFVARGVPDRPWQWDDASTGRFDLSLSGVVSNSAPGVHWAFGLVLDIYRAGSQGPGFDYARDLRASVAWSGALDGGGLRLQIELQPHSDFDWTMASGSGLFPGTVALVPEPGSLALWLGGGALLAALRRRRTCAVAGVSRRWHPHLAALAAAIGVAACGSGSGPETAPPEQPTPATAQVEGRVRSAATGEPMAAVVAIGSVAGVQADAQGRYRAAEVAAGERVLVRAQASGFVPALRVLALPAHGQVTANFVLQPVGVEVQVDAAAGGVVDDAATGARVVLPAGALQRADGSAASGLVRVRLTSIAPAIDPTRMPGDYSTADGGRLESFGAVAVEVVDANGTPLNLAPGRSAALRIPLSTRAALRPASVGLYALDKATGRWRPEGAAALAGDADRQWYEATVAHFSWWNADQPMQTVVVRGCLRTADGQPAPGRHVKSDGVDYTGSALARTDEQGAFAVAMKREGRAWLAVVDDPGTAPPPVLVGPSQADIELGACAVERSAAARAPTLLTQPVDASAVAGDTVRFSVLADGSAPLAYRWQRNGVDLAGAGGPVLAWTAAAQDGGADFRVVVSNAAGEATSHAARLTLVPVPLQPPVIVSAPLGRTVQAGTQVTLTVAVTGTAPLAYQWQRNGGAIAGETGSSLVFTAQPADDGARFSVTVRNAAGTVTSTEAVVTVQAAAQAPRILVGPQDVTTTVGGAVQFTVLVEGSEPLSWQWRRNGVDIAGATRSTLGVVPTAADDGARYSVVVRNPQGSATSGEAVLTLRLEGEPGGTLAVAGNAPASVGGSFVSQPDHAGARVVATGPQCSGQAPGAVVCNASFSLTAIEQTIAGGTVHIESVIVNVLSSSTSAPGPQPGSDPTAMVLGFSVVESGIDEPVVFTALCGGADWPACADVGNLGVQVDLAARSVRFNGVVLRSETDPARTISLQGTLRF